jgi:hypothetical protein
VLLAGGQRKKVVRLFSVRFGFQELASLFRFFDDDLNGVPLRTVNVKLCVMILDETNCLSLAKAL